jgi:hypothetical protein
MIKIGRINIAKKVLFDTYRSEILIDTVLGKENWTGLDVRFDNSPSLLRINLFSFIYILRFFITKSKKYFPLSVRKRLVLSYLSSVIEFSQAGEVYSLYGSSSIYYKHLSEIHFDMVFRAYITHQVHERHLVNLSTSPNCFYYVMGSYDKDQITSIGVPKHQIKPIGSLYSKRFLTSGYLTAPSDSFDIVLISQYQHYWELEECSETRIIAMKIFNKIVEFLCEILKDNPSLSLAIALRPQPSKEATCLELAYFENFFSKNNNITFLPNNPIKFSSYVALINARLVITHYSTLAFEAMAFKTKVLFCQFYDYSSKFRIPDDIEHVCRDDSYSHFSMKFYNLLNSETGSEYFENMKIRYNDIED